MVKKVTNRKSLEKILTDSNSTLFDFEARDIVKLLEKKGYIEVEQPKFNIVVPSAFGSIEYSKDIYSKKLGFFECSVSNTNREDCQFTQEEIDNNIVLKQLEAFKVEVK